MKRKTTKDPADFLLSRVQKNLLLTFLEDPRWEWTISELADHAGVNPSSLQRALKRFTEAMLLATRKEGREVFYWVNLKSKLYEPLRQMLGVRKRRTPKLPSLDDKLCSRCQERPRSICQSCHSRDVKEGALKLKEHVLADERARIQRVLRNLQQRHGVKRETLMVIWDELLPDYGGKGGASLLDVHYSITSLKGDVPFYGRH